MPENIARALYDNCVTTKCDFSFRGRYFCEKYNLIYFQAPKSGVIKKIHVSVGDVVDGDQKILEFE